eukprot:10807522-Ditylum_brightwellii.AAC.1
MVCHSLAVAVAVIIHINGNMGIVLIHVVAAFVNIECAECVKCIQLDLLRGLFVLGFVSAGFTQL